MLRIYNSHILVRGLSLIPRPWETKQNFKEGTVNFRLVVQKHNIEFQIDQSHSAKLSGLPNAIGQFTFQYCVFVDNQLEIYGIGKRGSLEEFKNCRFAWNLKRLN